MLPEPVRSDAVLSALVLAVVLLLFGRAVGSEVAPCPSPRIRYVYIPADEVKIVFQDASQGVLMAREEILALWRTAQQREAEAAAEGPQVEAMLASADYEGELDGQQLRLTGRLELVNWQRPWQAVELTLGGLAIESAQLNGQPARLGVTEQGTPFVVLESLGRFQLDLELSAPLLRQAGDLAATLQLPPAPASELRVRLAPHRQLQVGGTRVPAEVAGEERAWYRIAIDPAGRLPLVVSDRGADGERGSPWFVTSRAWGHLEPAGFRWDVTVDLEIFGRATETITLRVPESVEVVQVQSPQLAGWSLGAAEAGELPIQLTFHRPIQGSCSIQLSGLSPLPLAATWRVPTVRVPAAVSHVGHVGLQAAPNLRVEVGELLGLRPEVSDQTFGFVFWDEDFRLPLQVTERRRELLASVATLVRVRRSGLALRGSVTVTPRYAPLFEVHLQLPRAWSVQTVISAGQPQIWAAGEAAGVPDDAASQLQTLRIDLGRALPAGETVEILVHAEKRPVPWLEDPFEGPTAFREIGWPELRVLDADEVEGTLAIVAPADLELQVSQLSDDLQPIAGTAEREAGESAASTVLQYGYQDRAELAGRLQVRRRLARVAAETLAFVRLERDQLDVHYQLDLEIRGGDLRELRFALPPATGDSLRMSTVDSAARVQEQRRLVEVVEQGVAAGQVWQIVLDRPVSGQLTLAVDLSQPLAAPREGADRAGGGERAGGEAGPETAAVVPVPVLVLQDVVRQSGRVVVEAASDQQLDFRVRGLRDLDPAAVAEPAAYRPQQRIVAAYQYPRLPYQLGLVPTRHPTASVLEAVCSAAELMTVVGAGGSSHHRARFWLRSRQTRQVPIRLPETADLWSVMLDGQPIAVRRRGSEYLVPLPAASDPAGDGTRELTLVYETVHPVPRFGRVGLWRWHPSTRQMAPQIGLTTLQTTWYIQSPDGTDLVSSRGDFRLDEPFRRQSLASRLAETVARHSTQGWGAKIAGLGLAGLVVGFYSLVTARTTWRKRLIELAVVGGALVLLVLLLLPATQTAREAARRSQCSGNLKQLTLALHNYHEDYGQFPPAAIGPHNVARDRQFSWIVALLPYLEQTQLYQQLRLELPWDHPHNLSLLAQVQLPVFRCPSEPAPRTAADGFQRTSFVAVTGAATRDGPGSSRGVIDFDRGLSFSEIIDGTSNTLVIGEVVDGGPWFAAGNGTARAIESWIDNRTWSHHPGGANFGLADGAVRFLSQHLEADVLWALATARAGDVVPSPAQTVAAPQVALPATEAEAPAEMALPAADQVDGYADEPADGLELPPESAEREPEPSRPPDDSPAEPAEDSVAAEPATPPVPFTRGDRARLSLPVVLLPHGEPAFRFRREGGAGEIVLGLQDRAFAQGLQMLLVAAALLVAWLARAVKLRLRLMAWVAGLALPIGLAGLLPLAWVPLLDGLLWGACAAGGLWIMTGLLTSNDEMPITPLSTALALAASWLVAGTAMADRYPAESPASHADRVLLSQPDLTVFVPYDLEQGQPLQSKQGFLAREDFSRLWRQAFPKPPAAILPQPSAFVSHAEFTGRLVNDQAHFEGQLVIHHLGSGWQHVPLPLGEVAWEYIEIEGQTATLATPPSGDGPPAIYLEEPGRHLVPLRFEVPVNRLGATGQMRLPLRPVPAGSLRFQLPADDLEVQVTGSVGGWRQELPEGNQPQPPEGPLLVIPLGAVRDLTIHWQPRHVAAQEEHLTHVDQTTQVLIQDSGVHLLSEFHYQIQQGVVRELQLRIPSDVVVVDVQGDDVADWSIETGTAQETPDVAEETDTNEWPDGQTDQVDTVWGGQSDVAVSDGSGRDESGFVWAENRPELAVERRLVIRLKSERSTSTDVVVEAFHGQVPETGQLTLRTLEPLGAARERGRLAVAAAPHFGVRVQDVEGLDQIDRSKFESPASAASDLALLATYRYTARPWQMGLQIARLRPELEVFDRTAIQVGGREITLHCVLTAQVTVAPLASLTLRLPAELRVSELQVPDGATWFLDRGPEGQHVMIRLDKPRMGPLELILRGEMPRDISRSEFLVPGVEMPGVAQYRGQRAIGFDEDWQAVLVDAGGAGPLEPSQVDSALQQVLDGPPDYAFHYDSTGEPIRFELTKAPSRLIGQVTTVVSVRAGELAYLSNLDLEIRQAARAEFQLVTPEWLGADLELRGAEIRQVYSETDGQQRRWRIQLQQPVRGTYRLQLTQTLPLPEDRTLRAALIRPQDAERLQQYIVLENLTSDQIVPHRMQGVASVSPNAAPESLAENLRRQATAIYRVDEDDAQLTWERRMHELQAGLQAAIPLVDLTTVIHRDGSYRAQAVYRIRNFTLQFLEVELPVHSQVWSVQVADQPVRPAVVEQPGSSTLLLPLQRTSAGDFSSDVVLVYGGHLGRALRHWSHVRFPVPQIVSDVPVSRTLWTVYLPDEYRLAWFDADSNLERVPAASLHDERQRSFLDELRELVQVASHPGESAARSKAYWNIQQLGATLQDYAQPQLRRADIAPADVRQQAQQIEAEIRQLEHLDREAEHGERGADFYFREQTEQGFREQAEQEFREQAEQEFREQTEHEFREQTEQEFREQAEHSIPPRDALRRQAEDQLLRLKSDSDHELQPAEGPVTERSVPAVTPLASDVDLRPSDPDLLPVGTAHHFRKLHGDPLLALHIRHQDLGHQLAAWFWAGLCLVLAVGVIRGLTRPQLAGRIRQAWPNWVLLAGLAWLFLLPAALLGWLVLVTAACVRVTRARRPQQSRKRWVPATRS